MSIPKKIDKILKQIDHRLPETFTLYDGNGFQEIENRDLTEARLYGTLLVGYQDPKILTDRRKVVKVKKVRSWPVNHLRRLRKAWIENKEEGVIKYIEWVNAQNKFVSNVSEQIIAMRLVNESIKTIF